MKCLVTGGAGFIGSNLALHLEELGHEVIIADDFSTGNKDNLTGFGGKVISMDISNVEIEGQFDCIFHQAAITDPRHPDDREVLYKNVNGFKNMLTLAKKCNAKLIYASTASLYGNTAAPQKEEQEKELMSAYAQSKLITDEMASYHFASMHIVGLRYFNVFGPKELHKGRAASMIYHLANQIKKGKTPRIFKMGQQKRDHIYVKDCVLANIKAMGAPSGIYNVGTGIGTTFNELVSILNDVLGTNNSPEYIENPYVGTYQDHTQADTTRAENVLKFESKYSLKEGIKEYMESL